MQPNRDIVAAFEEEFSSIRSTAESAISQLDSDQIRVSPDDQTNSVIIVMKHIAGNFRSRFTDFLTQDGEKPWRQRDNEFIDDFPPGENGRQAAIDCWNAGWQCALDQMASLTDDDLKRIVTIRGEPLTVARALSRSVAHVGYHTGQIVWLARSVVGPGQWKTITIPRGKSKEFNQRLGYQPGR